MVKFALKETIRIKERILIEKNSLFHLLSSDSCCYDIREKVNQVTSLSTSYVTQHRVVKNSIKYKILRKYHQEWTGRENV